MLMRSGGGAYIRKASDWLLSPYCQITFYCRPHLSRVSIAKKAVCRKTPRDAAIINQ